MPTRELSPREEEIVELCVEGLTNEAIAQRLGLSVGTVNTYWLRIKLKVGGSGRTDTVVRIIRDRAERTLREESIERKHLTERLAMHEQRSLEHRAALALLHLAMDQINSTVWATDKDLIISILANGEFPSTQFGSTWEVGRTIYEIFRTTDDSHPAIQAHLKALRGEASDVQLGGELSRFHMRVMPLLDEGEEVMGSITILEPGTRHDVASVAAIQITNVSR